MLEELIFKAIAKVAARCGESVFVIRDIIYDSRTKQEAYTRGYAIGGIGLAIFCATYWSLVHNGDDGSSASGGMLLKA